MSIEIQKQIKDNATSVSDFFSDLYKWTEEQEKEEKRREIRKTASKVGVSEAQKLLAKSHGSNGGSNGSNGVPVRNGTAELGTGSEPTDPIRRDGTAMAQYYSDWDQYDPDAEVDKIEDEAFQQQRAEREARQAEKDRILDEMALKPNGDRSRTSAARPRVKVSVRRSGRKVAPVDLAAPRKDEANRLFGAGRYREAIASYTAALDCLEKYEPPDEPSDQAKGENGGVGPDHDSPGQEQEAIALKVALLANRALACFKLEVLPSLRLFTLKSGAAPKEWRQALSRGVRPCKAPEARSAPDPFDAARWDDVLSSDRQRAVLRSLQAATSLGIPEADMLVQELAADFCRCERLARAARRAHAQVAKQSKPKAAQVERWRLAPFRCVAEVEREEARPHTERGPRSPRVLRPLDLQIGPVRSCDGLDASIARLVQVEPEPEAPAAPAAPRLRRPSSQATGRRPSGARHAPHRQR